MTNKGTITVEDGQAVITFRRRLPYPIVAVWQAITDPEERAVWFGKTTLDPRVGGEIESVPTEPPAAEEQKRMTGRILRWEPPHVFEHESHQRIVEPGVVRWELERDGDEATYVTYVHSGLTERNAQGFVPGSHAFLDRLEKHLEHEEIPGWQARYDAVKSLYA